MAVDCNSDGDAEPPESTQYVGDRCVVLTYFKGDVGSIVDDHFTKALAQPSSFNAKHQGTRPNLSTSASWKLGNIVIKIMINRLCQ